ncbi:ketosynthase chain-length factor [Streptomyces sp. NPDC035033]|uniref:ketosynthase chain-length factor n=1 Tax=Streptomyces sp. NPDC035033 TaxID=3155368 RepID=UPI0033CA1147
MTAAVITGLGIASPNGLGLREYWAAVLRGHNGIRPISRFDASGYPARLAGEITGFTAREHLPARLLPQTDRTTRMTLAAADWALRDAGLDPAAMDSSDIGVATAASSGGFEFGQRELRNLWSSGPEHVSAYQSFAWFYAVNSGQLSIRHGTRGPSGVLVGEQAGGLDAMALARRNIRKGTVAVISGAVDSALCPWGWVAHLTGGRLSTADDPRRAYLPFDPRAHGHVPGEGGAVLIVEARESADTRGAHGYGELAGYGATMDPAPGTGRPPGLRRAVELALEDASVLPEDVDVVFADAAGTPELDAVEAEALNAVFGPGRVPVTAPKTLTGRLSSGAGPLDLATACLAMRDSVVPHTAHVRPRQEYELDLVVGEPRPGQVRTALVVARGHGGFNSALVVTALTDR